MPSVVMDLKSVFTIKPDGSGAIAFMLTPSSNGCLTITTGSLSGSVTTTYRDVASNTGWGTTSTVGGTPVYGTISDSRVNSMLTNLGSGGSSTWQSFRTIMAVADVCYTGSSMMDAGSALVGTIGSRLMQSGTRPNTYSTSSVEDVVSYSTTRAGNVLQLAGMPSSVALSARKNFRMRVMPSTPEFQRLAPCINFDQDNQPLGYVRLATATGDWIAPTYDPSVPWKAVSYAGLDSTASVTVTLRHCVEYIVDDESTMAPLAGPSPANDPPARTFMEAIAAKIPTIETIEAGIDAAGRLFGTAAKYKEYLDTFGHMPYS